MNTSAGDAKEKRLKIIRGREIRMYQHMQIKDEGYVPAAVKKTKVLTRTNNLCLVRATVFNLYT